MRLLVRGILLAIAMVGATLVFVEEVLVTGLILSAVYAVTVSLVLGRHGREARQRSRPVR